MAHIRVDDKEFELSGGELRVGTGEDADLRLDAPPGIGTVAIIAVDGTGAAVIRRASSTAVWVNGVPLGAEPSPLLHGDRIEVVGRQLRFSDDRNAGTTVLVPALGVPSPVRPVPDPGSALGDGRLVSLVDGREYAIPPGGIRIGRDANCDVVVTGPEVSRQHAEIVVDAGGYALRDLSANGVLLNGHHAQDAQRLRRGDVLRVGSEEFRFYAEPAGDDRAAPVMAQEGATPRAARPTRPLATLVVMNDGIHRGKTYDLATPLSHVGRGAHNDVALSDDSVSDSHAKLQRRDDGWFVVDMSSTNGTYVGGRRVAGEAPLHADTDVRFGGVKMMFRLTEDAGAAAGGTRVIVGVKRPDARAAGPTARASTSMTADATASRRIAPLVWIAAAVLIGAAVLFVIQDR